MEAIYRKISRRILPLLFLAYIAAYLDRVNVAFAKLQMLEQLQWSETVYGLSAGIFFIGYFLFEVPSNLVLHRVGARRWLARIMISWGLISAATMFVTTPAAFYVLRFLLGAAEAGFFPGVIYYLTQWYPAERRGRVTAIFMTGIPVCSVIGSVVSGAILQSLDGVNGWAGWRWLFLLEALPSLLVGICIPFRLNDRIESVSWLTRVEKIQLRDALAADQGTVTETHWIEPFRDRRVWLACVIYFCLAMGLYGLGFWLPSIIAELGIRQPMKVGWLSAIPYSTAAIGMVLISRRADRSGQRHWHTALCAAMGAGGLILSVVVSRNLSVALLGLSLAACGVLAAAPLFWSLPTAYLRGSAAAAGIAFINSFGNLAGFLSPYLVGWSKDLSGSIATGVYLLAAFVFLGSVLIALSVPKRLLATTTRSIPHA